MFKIYSTLIIILSSSALYAQDFTCGTDQIHNNLMETDIEYATSYINRVQKWSNYAKSSDDSKLQQSASTTIYEVPVVFHIMHTGEAIGSSKNPSDATIFALMDELNQKFNATWTGNPSAENGGVDVPIIFKLAQRTPTCEPSNGINRIDASLLPGYLPYGVAYAESPNGANSVDLKALSIWPNTQYLNIWIVTDIQGGSIAGYAYYPGASSNVDGIVLKHNYISWAITHEVGHSLGLMHTFEGSTNSTMCPPNIDCTLWGDMICDTDPHPMMSTAVCPQTTNICTGTSFYSIAHNHMNYTSCPDRFTAGQKDLMLFSLINDRLSLTTSLGGIPADTSTPVSAPILACTVPEIVNVESGGMAGVYNVLLADLIYISDGYYGDNIASYYVDKSIPDCMMLTESVANLLLGNTYTITVTTGYYEQYVRGWLDFNNDGVFSNSEMIISNDGTLSFESHTAEISIPANATLNTSLRMRIATDLVDYDEPLPCSALEWGQTVDFAVVIKDILSVSDKKLSAFTISPNPTTNTLYFSEMLSKIDIYTIEGKKAFSDNFKKNINIGALQTGTYILRGYINDTNQNITKLIIKE